MKIVITGASGQVGQTIKKEIENSYTIFPLSKDEFDITRNDLSRIEKIDPDIIINAAAFTNVEEAEKNYQESMACNYLGPKYLSNFAFNNSIPLIHFSTDYVFNGENCIPYKENDETNPINIYGLSKLNGEKAISDKSIIIRTSWLYSIFQGNFLTNILEKIKNEEQISVVYDQVGSPTSCRSLAKVVKSVIEKIKFKQKIQNGVYHFSDSGQTTWYEFAKKINEYAFEYGLCKKINIKKIATNDLALLAKRPAFSVLNSKRLLNYYK